MAIVLWKYKQSWSSSQQSQWKSTKPNNITPSQEKITEGEKVRKADMAKKEEKLDKYNRNKGEIAEQESENED